jgi:hypothetical protein
MYVILSILLNSKPTAFTDLERFLHAWTLEYSENRKWKS